MVSPAPYVRIWLALAIVAVAIGIFARVAHLDRKLFWQDEEVTALRVSGHSFAELYPLFDGKARPIGDVRRLIERDPSTDVATVVRTLAAEDPHHAPLFYVLDRLSLDAVGTNRPSAYRLPSVVFGIVAIGFAFLLGRTLYRSRLGGAVLAALVAVSPLHVLYSRQAREYALFTCLVFASSYFLLRGIEKRGAVSWIAYALTVALGIYTDPVFVLVIASHTVCAVVLLRREPRALVAWFLATSAGIVAFAPWALNALNSKGSIEAQLAWGATEFPLKFLAEKWAFNISAVFFDAEFADLRLAAVAAIVVLVALGAAAVFVRSGDNRARALALPLTLIPMGTFVALDLFEGSHFATIPRYVTAGWIGLEIVVASALVAGISARARTAQAALAFLIVAGAVSAVVDNGAVNWWDNNNQIAYQLVAQTIDETAAPLVLDDGLNETALILAHYVRSDASIVLFHGAALPALPPGTHRAYLVAPPGDLLRTLTEQSRSYALANVSPQAINAITRFHQGLAHDKSFVNNYAPVVQERPENALWLLTHR